MCAKPPISAMTRILTVLNAFTCTHNNTTIVLHAVILATKYACGEGRGRDRRSKRIGVYVRISGIILSLFTCRELKKGCG